MKNKLRIIAGIILLASWTPILWAQTTDDEPTPSGPVSLQVEQEKLDIEKLKLENQKLQLQMDQLRLQATQTAVPAAKSVSAGPSPTPSTQKDTSKEELKIFQADYSKKVEELAKANKDKENLLVLDMVNAEVWHKGVRYNIHELYTLAQDRGWKMTQKLDERDVAGHARNLYQYLNLSLLRYENRDRGIFAITFPAANEEFDFLTPEGISFMSSTGDVRNAFQSLYFAYERTNRQGKYDVLRYNHDRGLAFSDKLDFYFDRNGKLAQLKYGVLDEH